MHIYDNFLLLLLLLLLFSDIDLFFTRRIRKKLEFLGGVNSMNFDFFRGRKIGQNFEINFLKN